MIANNSAYGYVRRSLLKPSAMWVLLLECLILNLFSYLGRAGAILRFGGWCVRLWRRVKTKLCVCDQHLV